MRTLSYFILSILFTLQACKQTPSSVLSISGQVLDTQTHTPVQGVQVRLEAVLSPARDSQISATFTDKEGRYALQANREVVSRYSKGLHLRAALEDTGQYRAHKNPYQTDKKGAPYLFFHQSVLDSHMLAANEIRQDITMQAGGLIACYSPLPSGLPDTSLLLDVTAIEKPRDHFRMVINGRRYLVVKPGHPYSLRVIYQYPGDTAAIEQIIKEDTVRLQPMETLKVDISYDMIKTVTGRLQ